jgi:hypothetical protein
VSTRPEIASEFCFSLRRDAKETEVRCAARGASAMVLAIATTLVAVGLAVGWVLHALGGPSPMAHVDLERLGAHRRQSDAQKLPRIPWQVLWEAPRHIAAVYLEDYHRPPLVHADHVEEAAARRRSSTGTVNPAPRPVISSSAKTYSLCSWSGRSPT